MGPIAEINTIRQMMKWKIQVLQKQVDDVEDRTMRHLQKEVERERMGPKAG